MDSVTSARHTVRSSPIPPPALSHDKSRSRVKGLEILDVQIVHSHFHRKGLLDERHQLDRKQGIDDARFKQIVVVVQFGMLIELNRNCLTVSLSPFLLLYSWMSLDAIDVHSVSEGAEQGRNLGLASAKMTNASGQDVPGAEILPGSEG